MLDPSFPSAVRIQWEDSALPTHTRREWSLDLDDTPGYRSRTIKFADYPHVEYRTGTVWHRPRTTSERAEFASLQRTIHDLVPQLHATALQGAVTAAHTNEHGLLVMDLLATSGARDTVRFDADALPQAAWQVLAGRDHLASMLDAREAPIR